MNVFVDNLKVWKENAFRGYIYLELNIFAFDFGSKTIEKLGIINFSNYCSKSYTCSF